MSNGKDMIIHVIVELIKKRLNWMKFACIKMRQYFSKPYEPFGGEINVKADLSNYATIANLESATGVDASKLAARSDLAILKAEVDKLYIDKLIPVPVDLSKLSDVVKIILLKKLFMTN